MKKFREELLGLCIKHNIFVDETDNYVQDENGDEVQSSGEIYFKEIGVNERFYISELIEMLNNSRAKTK